MKHSQVTCTKHVHVHVALSSTIEVNVESYIINQLVKWTGVFANFINSIIKLCSHLLKATILY